MLNKERIAISIDKDILATIDKDRGSTKRSTYINDILRKEVKLLARRKKYAKKAKGKK